MYGQSLRRHAFLAILPIFAGVLLNGQPSIACLWMYGTDVHGHRVSLSSRGPQANDVLSARKTDDTPLWEKKRIELQPAVERGEYQAQSDYAVTLIHLGELEKAIGLLESIENEHPGEYVTATNLGTAYELHGDDQKALEWIKEGMQRNSRSHYGTEWLHVKILEAKLHMAQDPNWIKRHSILGLDFGRDLVPDNADTKVTDYLGHVHDLDDIRSAIEYQLQERLVFVKPPDPLIADLLSDLGNVLALTKSVEFAIPIYELALEYQPTNPQLVQHRLDHFRRLAAGSPHELEHPLGYWIAHFVPPALLLGLAALILLVVWRRRRNRSAAPSKN